MTGLLRRCRYSEMSRSVGWTEVTDVHEQCHGLHLQGQSVKKKRVTLLGPIYPEEEGPIIVSHVRNYLGFERAYNGILNSYSMLCAFYTSKYL